MAPLPGPGFPRPDSVHRLFRGGGRPGVLRVLTSRDVPGQNVFGTFNPEQPVFCEDEVCFLGDMIAMAVADTEEHARAAAKLVEVAYEVLPGVFEIEDSHAWGGRQVIRTIDFSKGDYDAETRRPGLVHVEGDYYFERQGTAPWSPVAFWRSRMRTPAAYISPAAPSPPSRFGACWRLSSALRRLRYASRPPAGRRLWAEMRFLHRGPGCLGLDGYRPQGTGHPAPQRIP